MNTSSSQSYNFIPFHDGHNYKMKRNYTRECVKDSEGLGFNLRSGSKIKTTKFYVVSTCEIK